MPKFLVKLQLVLQWNLLAGEPQLQIGDIERRGERGPVDPAGAAVVLL